MSNLVRWPDISRFGGHLGVMVYEGSPVLAIEVIDPVLFARSISRRGMDGQGFKLSNEKTADGNDVFVSDKGTLSIPAIQSLFPSFRDRDMGEMDRKSISLRLPEKQQSQSLPEGRVQETPKQKIVDVGEKIGGARKDLYKRLLRPSDLENMTEAEKRELVKKDMVFPPINYREMRDSGISPTVAYFLKMVRDKLPVDYTKFDAPTGTTIVQSATTTIQSQMAKSPAAYIRSLETIYKEVGIAKSVEEIQQGIDRLRARRHGVSINDAITGGEGSEAFHRYVEGLELSTAIGRKAYEVLFRNAEIYLRQAARMADRYGWDKLIRTRARVETSKKEGLPERPHLQHIVREGGKDWRAGRDVSADELLGHFGFRGIEFGNWLPQDERQSVINFAYDALNDLADLVGVDPKGISLGGRLALAFGARGVGRASAHYEPGRTVVNLTRISGAGATAHEWWHAIDDCDLNLAGQQNYGAYLSEKNLPHDLHPHQPEVQENTASGMDRIPFALGSVRGAIEKRYLTVSEMKEKREADAKRIGSWAKGWASSAARDMTMPLEARELFIADSAAVIDDLVKSASPDAFATNAMIHALFSKASGKRMDKKHRDGLEGNVNALERAVRHIHELSLKAPGDPVSLTESFYKESSKHLDEGRSKPYWATRREMFARAFECWVFDRMRDRGMRSDYLVHGVEDSRFVGHSRGNPYPHGDERQLINKQFDSLMKEVADAFSEKTNPATSDRSKQKLRA